MKKTLFALLVLLSITLSSCFLGWGEYFKRSKDLSEGWERRKEESKNISFEEATRQLVSCPKQNVAPAVWLF